MLIPRHGPWDISAQLLSVKTLSPCELQSFSLSLTFFDTGVVIGNLYPCVVEHFNRMAVAVEIFIATN